MTRVINLINVLPSPACEQWRLLHYEVLRGEAICICISFELQLFILVHFLRTKTSVFEGWDFLTFVLLHFSMESHKPYTKSKLYLRALIWFKPHRNRIFVLQVLSLQSFGFSSSKNRVRNSLLSHLDRIRLNDSGTRFLWSLFLIKACTS